MPATSLVQTRVDPDIKARAAEVLGDLGLTVSDEVRILLTRTAREGALPFELLADSKSHDVWVRRKVEQALHDTRADVDHDMVEAEFAGRRAAAVGGRGNA